MRKVIAAFNMTIDGICDHTAGLPDDEIHEHYTQLLNGAGVILYGRTTFQLMEFWRPFLDNPSGEKAMDDFAISIDRVPKIVFSRTLNAVDWNTAALSDKTLEDTIIQLRQQPGNDIFIGSRSLIVQLSNLNLIDEYQLCIYPVLAGNGLPLFGGLNERKIFKLLKTKIFTSGALILYYGC